MNSLATVCALVGQVNSARPPGGTERDVMTLITRPLLAASTTISRHFTAGSSSPKHLSPSAKQRK